MRAIRKVSNCSPTEFLSKTRFAHTSDINVFEDDELGVFALVW